MPEPCSPVELALVEFQIAGGAQGAVGELQPQRLIDADAIAAASAYEGRSVVVHEGDALEALTRTRLCPTVRRPLCPGSGLSAHFLWRSTVSRAVVQEAARSSARELAWAAGRGTSSRWPHRGKLADSCSFPRGGVDGQRAAQQLGALAHPMQSETVGVGGWVEPATVVADREVGWGAVLRRRSQRAARPA